MTQKDFRKLNRAQLLEVLLAQAEEIERLQAQCKELDQQLQNRQIVIDQAGSIAEASLKINEVFESAQAAASEYLKNIRTYGTSGETESELLEKARTLLIQTEQHCARMEQETLEKCDAMLRKSQESIRSGEKKAFRAEDFIW